MKKNQVIGDLLYFLYDGDILHVIIIIIIIIIIIVMHMNVRIINVGIPRDHGIFLRSYMFLNRDNDLQTVCMIWFRVGSPISTC